MKKKIIFTISVIAILITCLAGCSSSLAFNKLVGFKPENVEKVLLFSATGGYKELNEKQTNLLFDALDKVSFVKNKDDKMDSDMYINYTYKIQFFIKGENGYFEMVVNNGIKKVDKFNFKNTKEGFYNIENVEEFEKVLRSIYYLDSNQ